MGAKEELMEAKYKRLSRMCSAVRRALSSNEMDRLYNFGKRNAMNGPRNCKGAEVATMVASRLVYETEGSVTPDEAREVISLMTEEEVDEITVVLPEAKAALLESMILNEDGERLLISDDKSTAHIAPLNTLTLRDGYNMRNALELNNFAYSALCNDLLSKKMYATAYYPRSEINQGLLHGLSFPGIAVTPFCEKCAERFREERSLGLSRVV